VPSIPNPKVRDDRYAELHNPDLICAAIGSSTMTQPGTDREANASPGFVDESTRLEASRINQLAPIACLAPEILSEVFVHCVPTSYQELSRNFSWIKVTHVSRYWREVALACPELWTSIIFSRPNWIPVMLSRAKMAPLVIRTDLSRDRIDLLQPVLDKHISTVRELDIRASQSTLETLFKYMMTETPLLESLLIWNTNRDNLGMGGFWLPDSIPVKPTAIETKRIPSPSRKLRYLELRSCAFPWDSPRYNNLTHFKLYHIHHAQRPNMTGLLAILVTMQGLQDLTLVEATPSAEECFIVDLPHLLRITLQDPAINCASLLEHLTFPLTTIMTIICPALITLTWTFESEVCKRLIPAIAEHCNIKPVYNFVRIKHTSSSGMRVILNHPRGYELLNLHLRCGGWPPTFAAKATGAIFHVFSIAHVSALELEGLSKKPDSKEEFKEWVELWRELSRFKSLRALHLNQTTPPMVLEVLLQRAMHCIGICLEPSTEHIGSDGISRQLLPRLERIVLRHLDCGIDAGTSGPSFMDSLRSLLWARRQGKTVIPKLEIRNCRNLFLQDLAHLKFFADVTWDGKGKNTADKEEGGDYPSSFSINVFAQMTALVS